MTACVRTKNAADGRSCDFSPVLEDSSPGGRVPAVAPSCLPSANPERWSCDPQIQEQ